LTVLVVKKPNSDMCTRAMLDMAQYLMGKGARVLVEPAVSAEVPNLACWDTSACGEDAETIHFVISIGGDGTMLHISSLFSCKVPPVLAFNFGSLGFLSPFPPDGYKDAIDRVVEGEIDVTVRRRLDCRVSKSGGNGWHMEDVAVNEITIARGVSPMVTVEVIMNGIDITTIEADGVIIATATGSTAYSLSAGGTVVHPSIPVMLLTPICPHSLTARPVILPENVQLTIRVAPESRGEAVVSVDGRKDVRLARGDYVKICASPHPIPCFSRRSGLEDWFGCLSHCLSWNSTSRIKRDNPGDRASSAAL